MFSVGNQIESYLMKKCVEKKIRCLKREKNSGIEEIFLDFVLHKYGNVLRLIISIE